MAVVTYGIALNLLNFAQAAEVARDSRYEMSLQPLKCQLLRSIVGLLHHLECLILNLSECDDISVWCTVGDFEALQKSAVVETVFFVGTEDMGPYICRERDRPCYPEGRKQAGSDRYQC